MPLMLLGRVGPLTLFIALVLRDRQRLFAHRPSGRSSVSGAADGDRSGAGAASSSRAKVSGGGDARGVQPRSPWNAAHGGRVAGP